MSVTRTGENDSRTASRPRAPPHTSHPSQTFKSAHAPADAGGSNGVSAMANSETMRVMCPNLTCRKILAVPETARGKTVRCRGCGTNIKVPGGASAATPATPGQAKPGAAAA